MYIQPRKSLVVVADNHRDHIGMLVPDIQAVSYRQARHAALDDQGGLSAHGVYHLSPLPFGMDMKYACARLFAQASLGGDIFHCAWVGYTWREPADVWC